MRLLLTGAAGFLGHECLSDIPVGTELIAVTRRGIPAWAERVPGVEWLEADLAEAGFQRRLPGGVDAVVHLAQSRFDRDFPEHADDVVDVNVAATARLLDYARHHGAGRFVLASTASVYRRGHGPLDEDAPLDLSSFYAASKRSAELLVGAYSDLVASTVLRVFTTYGAGQRRRLIAELIERVRGGMPVTLEGERGLMLSPIHVRDVAGVLHAAAASTRPGCEIVNVGGPEALGVREVVETIARELGTEPVFEPLTDDEPGGLVADLTRMNERFPNTDHLRFSEGMRLTLGDVTASA